MNSKWPQDLEINEVNTDGWAAEKEAATNGEDKVYVDDSADSPF